MRTYKFKLYASNKNKHLSEQINIAASIWNHTVALQRRYYKYFGKNMVYIGTRLEYKNGSKDYSKHADYDYLQTGLHMTDDQSYRNIYHNLNTKYSPVS